MAAHSSSPGRTPDPAGLCPRHGWRSTLRPRKSPRVTAPLMAGTGSGVSAIVRSLASWYQVLVGEQIKPSTHQKQTVRLLFLSPSTFSLLCCPEPWPQGRGCAAAGGFILSARTWRSATATDRGGSENRLERPGFPKTKLGQGPACRRSSRHP